LSSFIKIRTNFNIVAVNFFRKYIFIPLNFSVTHLSNKNPRLKKLKNYYKWTFSFFFFHFMWRGKAFRIRFYKKNNKITFNFNHSHTTKLIYGDNYSFAKLRRQLYLILFYDYSDLFTLPGIFQKIRVYNKYTKRGIRIKQLPYRIRFGKVSQVNSLLHSFG